ncbi:ATP-binding protein [Streptomyces sp. A0592]|uniref:ATP-binding protein n=1 Tax=Streptomyces sp. A0592 TaxID=2563099 RepID=UPI0026A57F57
MPRGDSTGSVDGPEAALLEALFGQSPIGLHVLDTGLRIVRANSATPAMRAAAAARHHVRRQLTTWNVDEETAFHTELIVSELVTNAVRYGKLPLEPRLIRGRTLACEPRDTSVAAPHLRHVGPADEGGRGLFIVGELADDWGVRYSDHGKTIWTEQIPAPQG